MRETALLLTAVLAGCAGAPGYRPPAVQVPPAFRESARPAADTLTDGVGDDPLPENAGATAGGADAGGGGGGSAAADSAGAAVWRALGDTTLDRLVAELRRSNLDVRAAEARIAGARAARLGSALDLAPTVTFAGGYTRQRLSSAAFPIGVGSFPDQSIWDAGFDAFWELDLFGRLRRNLQAQGAFVGAAEEDLRDVRVTLTAELARAYFELRGAEEQLAVARRNADNQRRTFQVTRERLEAGRGTAFDTERARAQLDLTLASIPALEARVADARYRIAVLVGRPPAAVAGELEGDPGRLTLPDSIVVASPDSVIRRRPDVAAAERRLAAGRALVGAAKSDYLPRLTVGGGAGFAATDFDLLGDRGTFRYAVGPVVSWPLLNLGRVKAGVDAARAREAEAEAQYTQSVLRALAEVETSLARYRAGRARVERIGEAARASERAAELARLRFTSGVADFLQVLDAERTMLEAEDQLAQARTEAATAYAALYKALGGALPLAGPVDDH